MRLATREERIADKLAGDEFRNASELLKRRDHVPNNVVILPSEDLPPTTAGPLQGMIGPVATPGN
eukprot:4999843-Lingulodinium_polyedra.AAC.1